MNRIINFRSLNVFRLEKDHWDYGYHNHNFYEIIIIEAGSGKHCLNTTEFHYQTGDVFMIAPADEHSFSIEEKTKFLYIKFTEEFLLEPSVMKHGKEWKDAVIMTLQSGNFAKGSMITNAEEKILFYTLSNLLLQEFTHSNAYKQSLITNIFSSLLIILVRNTNKIEGKQWLLLEGKKIEKILTYIRVNAMDRELMRIETIAKAFSMSASYISIFVKKHTRFSIQQHQMQYKMYAAEKLLKQSHYNINEISFKLGFNDASHFNKIFVKYRGVTPLQLRSSSK